MKSRRLTAIALRLQRKPRSEFEMLAGSLRAKLL
jgi:hypothetical protein